MKIEYTSYPENFGAYSPDLDTIYLNSNFSKESNEFCLKHEMKHKSYGKNLLKHLWLDLSEGILFVPDYLFEDIRKVQKNESLWFGLGIFLMNQFVGLINMFGFIMREINYRAKQMARRMWRKDG